MVIKLALFSFDLADVLDVADEISVILGFASFISKLSSCTLLQDDLPVGMLVVFIVGP
jgi:hypothetical protein